MVVVPLSVGGFKMTTNKIPLLASRHMSQLKKPYKMNNYLQEINYANN